MHKDSLRYERIVHVLRAPLQGGVTVYNLSSPHRRESPHIRTNSTAYGCRSTFNRSTGIYSLSANPPLPRITSEGVHVSFRVRATTLIQNDHPLGVSMSISLAAALELMAPRAVQASTLRVPHDPHFEQ
jgi:hypothetical protein